jgi:hypothetical protein
MAKLGTESIEVPQIVDGAALPTAAAPSTSAGRAATLFVGVTGSVDLELLRAKVASFGESPVAKGQPITIAYPAADTTRTMLNDSTELVSYPMQMGEGAVTPWANAAASQASLLALAVDAQAQSIVLLHPDLTGLTGENIERLAGPILARTVDLVMARYDQGPFDGLVNTSILAPLTRALYGKRVQFPLAADFAVSPRMAARLAISAHSGSGGLTVLWPGTVAAGIDAQVLEVPLAITHAAPVGEVDLSTVIGQLVGSVFAEMETHAPLWQRVRGSQPVNPGGVAAVAGAALAAAGEAGGIDTASMLNSFVLGARSLQDVWGLILPPVTLLDLKRLSRMDAASFRMPDELWVRVVYDFALSYRLRTINRTHLLGSLTPLYLGWVASYINQAKADATFDRGVYAERLARAFEDGKPYLVRRWRWPDRFNP